MSKAKATTTWNLGCGSYTIGNKSTNDICISARNVVGNHGKLVAQDGEAHVISYDSNTSLNCLPLGLGTQSSIIVGYDNKLMIGDVSIIIDIENSIASTPPLSATGLTAFVFESGPSENVAEQSIIGGGGGGGTQQEMNTEVIISDGEDGTQRVNTDIIESSQRLTVKGASRKRKLPLSNWPLRMGNVTQPISNSPSMSTGGSLNNNNVVLSTGVRSSRNVFAAAGGLGTNTDVLSNGNSSVNAFNGSSSVTTSSSRNVPWSNLGLTSSTSSGPVAAGQATEMIGGDDSSHDGWSMRYLIEALLEGDVRNNANAADELTNEMLFRIANHQSIPGRIYSHIPLPRGAEVTAGNDNVTVYMGTVIHSGVHCKSCTYRGGNGNPSTIYGLNIHLRQHLAPENRINHYWRVDLCWDGRLRSYYCSYELCPACYQACDAMFEDVEMIELLNQKFDLLILDGAFPECAMGMVHKYQAPFMYINTVGFYTTSVSLAGNPAPYSVTPVFYSSFTDSMTIMQRAVNTVMYLFMHTCHWDLEDFISASGDTGFIYVSMGSSVKAENMPEHLRQLFIQTFAQLPYQILWKWEGHRKLRAFVTHGELLSLFESVYHGKPVLSMPVFCGHVSNTAKAVQDGYALKLDLETLTSEKLLKGIIKIIHDPTFKQAAKTRQNLLLDQRSTPLKTAIYWTEYVIRHKGAYHLQTPARNLSSIQYYLIDIIGILIVSVFILVRLVKYQTAKRYTIQSNRIKDKIN